MKRTASLLLASLSLTIAAPAADFWALPRGGTNSFNNRESIEHLTAAKDFGASFVRVAIDKWKGKGRDFLAGDFDNYQGLVPEDAAQLRTVLDGAADKSVRVVITALGVPGSRWAQHNDGKLDDRIWRDKAWWDAAARYWGDIAKQFKGHRAVAGYNVLNEPVPETREPGLNVDTAAGRDAWCAKVKGTSRDVNGLYAKIVAAIRAEDKDTPIILDTGSWARPQAARCLEPVKDPHVLYAVHIYDPWEYTTAPATEKGRPLLSYPGPMTLYGFTRNWDAAAVAEMFRPLTDWADNHGIARNRLLLGEFGCWRRAPGCAAYLSDVLAAANAARMHWAFYSFREDSWDAMDYELGTGPAPPDYWSRPQAGSDPTLPRPPNPMSDTLKAALKRMSQ